MKKAMFTLGAMIWLLYVLLLTGCRMSEYEYNLRKQDIMNKANHPVTATIVIRGPLELKDGAVIEIPIQLFPYQNTPIPDGQTIWANVITNGVQTGALAASFMYGAHEFRKAKGNTRIINNYGEAQP